jgi:hypothetical protein
MTEIQASEGRRIPFGERLTCSVDEAVQVTGLSRSGLYERMRSGQLKFTKRGARRLVNVESLRSLVGAD